MTTVYRMNGTECVNRLGVRSVEQAVLNLAVRVSASEL
jgi:hypothetical protein